MWIDWVLAGLNTNKFCAVGVEGCVVDMTSFLSRHPGSPETLLFAAGADVTSFFNDIGHSYDARQIAKELLIAKGPAPPTVPWGRERVFSFRQRRLLKDRRRAIEIGMSMWNAS